MFVVDALQYDEAAERQSGVGIMEKSNDSDAASTGSHGGLTTGVVVGVLAALVLVSGLIVAAVCFRRRRRQQSTTSTGMPCRITTAAYYKQLP